MVAVRIPHLFRISIGSHSIMEGRFLSYVLLTEVMPAKVTWASSPSICSEHFSGGIPIDSAQVSPEGGFGHNGDFQGEAPVNHRAALHGSGYQLRNESSAWTPEVCGSGRSLKAHRNGLNSVTGFSTYPQPLRTPGGTKQTGTYQARP